MLPHTTYKTQEHLESPDEQPQFSGIAPLARTPCSGAQLLQPQFHLGVQERLYKTVVYLHVVSDLF